jgi:ribosomal protein L20A (L18A)
MAGRESGCAMRTLALAWLGANAAAVGYFLVRGWIVRQQDRDLQRFYREMDHAQAIADDRLWTYQRASARLLRDMGLQVGKPRPRLTESKEGVFVRASCEAEAAEILYIQFCSPVRAA